MASRKQQTEEAPTEQVVVDEVTEDAIVDPEQTPSAAAEPAEPETPAAAGDPTDIVWVTYVGHAHVVTFGATKLLPGIPTPMSREDAEGIATTPFEDVVVSETDPTPPPPEE